MSKNRTAIPKLFLIAFLIIYTYQKCESKSIPIRYVAVNDLQPWYPKPNFGGPSVYSESALLPANQFIGYPTVEKRNYNDRLLYDEYFPKEMYPRDTEFDLTPEQRKILMAAARGFGRRK